jgi:uncharacterized protein YjiK
VCSNCDTASKKSARRLDAAENYPIGNLKYDLNQPDEKYFLHDDLEEISGLSYYRPNQLACIQDEEGKLFIYDTEEKKIVERIRFGKSGDYEGLEVVNGQVYVVRSDGTLFRFKLDGTREVEAEQIKTALSKENDVEGLGYDPEKNQLLIVCKGSPNIGEERIAGKTIYAYDLTNNTFLDSPAFIINDDSLAKSITNRMPNGAQSKPLDLNPSGIALHPTDGKVYVLASEGKMLVVLNRDGHIASGAHLDPQIFKQPE